VKVNKYQEDFRIQSLDSLLPGSTFLFESRVVI